MGSTWVTPPPGYPFSPTRLSPTRELEELDQRLRWKRQREARKRQERQLLREPRKEGRQGGDGVLYERGHLYSKRQYQEPPKLEEAEKEVAREREGIGVGEEFEQREQRGVGKRHRRKRRKSGKVIWASEKVAGSRRKRMFQLARLPKGRVRVVIPGKQWVVAGELGELRDMHK